MAYASAIDITQFSHPNFEHSDLKNILALDIGGSLAKLVYKRVFKYRRSIPQAITCNGYETESELYRYTECEDEGQKLCFVKFETRHIEECLDFIVQEILLKRLSKSKNEAIRIKVTGGGAHKYRDLISSKLGVILEKEDEMECLIRGCVFMLQNIPEELFYYDKHAIPAHVFVSNCLSNTFPFLLVNVGSGVSILKVESPTSFQRVGGSSVGGGTFWGLGTLLSGGKYSFDELLQMADSGDHRQVDMLVKDIYGGAYENLRLPGDVIASSFGLAARYPQRKCELSDMVKSLLITVSNNVGQLACLYAKQYNLTQILFGGFFIRGHGLTMEVITYAVRFWSSGAYRALFLRHEGYLGAVGAFLKTSEEQQKNPKALWAENYVVNASSSFSHNSSLLSRSTLDKLFEEFEMKKHSPLDVNSSEDEKKDGVEQKQTKSIVIKELPHHFVDPVEQVLVEEQPSSPSNVYIIDDSFSKPCATFKNHQIDQFELDRVFTNSLELFPLIDSTKYLPDTWDLTHDKEARMYWLDCLEQGVEYHRQKAEQSQSNTLPDAKERSYQYAERYVGFLRELKINPSGRGVLTVRCLLSAQQHFLREFGFGDAFCTQKIVENRSALHALPSRLNELKKLNWLDRQFSIIMGLLAGNVFDWGANESVEFMANAPMDKFGVPEFASALAKIRPRPWLVDDYNKWIERMKSKTQFYHSVLIFCDNSGPDLLLGVLPLAVEFLNRGSKVILAANSGPAINDVTYQELELLIRMVARFEPVIKNALQNNSLLLTENGQTSPCLDFRLIASSLVQLTIRENVDLIIIEGMGRAVHCNLNANFSVDTLKVAVVKNSWLAHRLGGNSYDVVFKFETISSKIC